MFSIFLNTYLSIYSTGYLRLRLWKKSLYIFVLNIVWFVFCKLFFKQPKVSQYLTFFCNARKTKFMQECIKEGYLNCYIFLEGFTYILKNTSLFLFYMYIILSLFKTDFLCFLKLCFDFLLNFVN